jgi:hypothetical protein
MPLPVCGNGSSNGHAEGPAHGGALTDGTAGVGGCYEPRVQLSVSVQAADHEARPAKRR